MKVEQTTSSADGVATWPETATAVAVRLLEDDTIRVVAPCGLEDLFAVICRRNPRRATTEQYHQRIRPSTSPNAGPVWRSSTMQADPDGCATGHPACAAGLQFATLQPERLVARNWASYEHEVLEPVYESLTV
jgi:hypothetical protein